MVHEFQPSNHLLMIDKAGFDYEKAKNALLYICNKVGEAGFLKIFKILYFAEKKHLAEYGNMIIQERYIAMKNGPVPSKIYDIFKAFRNPDTFQRFPQGFDSAFELIGNHNIKAKLPAETDYLTPADMVCLDISIKENSRLSFSQLSDKSHDLAWNNANENDEISILDMARAEGADQQMINYIADQMEHKSIFFA